LKTKKNRVGLLAGLALDRALLVAGAWQASIVLFNIKVQEHLTTRPKINIKLHLGP
jgi:hypothetical protein